MPARIEVLFKKFIAGNCSQNEYEELMDYLQSNQDEALVRSMLQQVYETGEVTPVKAMPGRVWLRRSVAAAAVIAALLAGIWLLRGVHKDTATGGIAQAGVKAATRNAEQKYILLPDSTEVWVNAASTLEFPEQFDKKVREVYLKGEAFFDVKNADRIPFIVHTGDVSTRVLGTSFNIKAYPGQRDVVVAVKRGKVQVVKKDAIMATLEMGQRVQIGLDAGISVPAIIKTTKEEDVAVWTTGKLVYDDLPLQMILEDIQRTYNVSIRLQNVKLENERVRTALSRSDGPTRALENICELLGARLTLKDGIYVIE
ncbi:ferric-dicitrate binding protein FerR (iron transport regulator) [Filimonas zeae]|uniref:FecR family protein n=1 Tax=Filimonas zeae TaxID=1737353 RepID=A0A917IJZ8_9BACT|nr:FecR domain-containing protein [Filimonas zeae]MDR6337054.1 ferric-dicitrate binding protein FerR (iron transport regulator) [Filimonas zeae]GGH56778.1 hypothetical protein GCM10011379_00750 [Filimonas zeae]